MRTVVGTMTGTSMDGVDAVAVSIEGHGLEMIATFTSIASIPFDGIRVCLREMSQNEVTHCDELAQSVGERTRDAITALKLPNIDLIALHGQTIYHKPPKTIQLINPKPVIDAFDCTVLNQPRQMDVELGGEGAPITPLADWIMFRETHRNVAIVNLGGFCNVTMLPAGGSINDIRGFDVCCCNLLLNSIASERLGKPFDKDGALASQGRVDGVLYEELSALLFSQHHNKQSLGHLDDIGLLTRRWKDVPSKHLAATACAAIGDCITKSVADADCIYLAGGGCHNLQLANHITNSGTIAELGVPTQAREGMAMAILGALHSDGVSITLSQVTGRRDSVKPVGFAQESP